MAQTEACAAGADLCSDIGTGFDPMLISVSKVLIVCVRVCVCVSNKVLETPDSMELEARSRKDAERNIPFSNHYTKGFSTSHVL